jgi:hypothetical protein
MYLIQAQNVRDALPNALKFLMRTGEKETTRNGDALVSPKPMAIRYRYPKQHVLINAVRDANPFFHLMEAMWMLAGRQDGAFLDYYIKDFSKTFGVNGIIPDAYGYRWRCRLGYDQLEEIIDQLKNVPGTRQTVLQMWYDDLISDYNIKPCNLIATFRIRHDRLDMTVFNRSNDLIWGACGANAVHFPIMQEYVASMIGIEMGHYWQISTNMHLYTHHQDMLFDRQLKAGLKHLNLYTALRDLGDYGPTIPLVKYPESFDNEILETVEMIENINEDQEIYDGNLSQPFLRDVVLPMAQAHRWYKKRCMAEAFVEMERVIAEDWKRAGIEWIKRRTSVRVGEEEYGQPV